MFKVLIGDTRDGRLVRLPYLGYSLLLILLIGWFRVRNYYCHWGRRAHHRG